MSWDAIINERDDVLDRVCRDFNVPYSVVRHAMDNACSDCCGAYRHSRELDWARNLAARLERGDEATRAYLSVIRNQPKGT